MNKKAMEETTPKQLVEIIAGVIVSGAIIFILVIALSSGSTTVVDNANIKAQNSLAVSLAYTMNTNFSGGEHTMNAWNFYSGSKNIVYAIVYLPQKSAGLILDIWTEPTVSPLSFVHSLDIKSIDKMEKCLAPDEACFCLFKLDYNEPKCIPEKNVITVSVNGPADSSVYSSVYAYEMDRIELWIKNHFVYVMFNTDFKQASIIDCVPMKEKGCTYIDADGTSKACIPHYGYHDNVKPVVWINTKAGNPLAIETTIFDATSYSYIPASTSFGGSYLGVFPRIQRFYEQYNIKVDEDIFEYHISTDKDAVKNGTDIDALNWGNQGCR
jgi:hypothetical protein